MRSDGRVHYGVARVELHLPGVDSLKGRRALVNRARAALERELGVSVAEVTGHDRWQRATLGIAVASSSATGVERVLERLVAVVERDPRVVVLAREARTDTLDGDETYR